MNTEEISRLKSILEASHVIAQKSTLFLLARAILPQVRFNQFSETYLNGDYNIGMAVHQLVEMWRSYKGKGATLENFAEILRGAYFNHEAGEYFPVG